MIIFSTTLSTMSLVIGVYGGTTWIQHSGYILRGATSGVTANSASKTGGEDTHTLSVNEMPSHNHGQKSLSGGVYIADTIVRQSGNAQAVNSASGIISLVGASTHRYVIASTGISTQEFSGIYGFNVNATHTHDSNGGGAAHNNIPNYKSVYIWERTA